MTTTTKIAGEAMTDDQIYETLAPIADEEIMARNKASIIAAGRALLASKPAVPEGWKLVPVEPSEEMIQAACLKQSNTAFHTYYQWLDSHSSGVSARIRQLVAGDYRAMLAASPTAPAQSCGGAEQADEAVTDEQIANRFLKEDDFAALFTFHSQCSDSECDGYTERPETMERLAELGVVQRLIGGRGKRYGTTAFGAWLVEAAFSQNPGWPLRTTAEHNKRESAGHALYLRESVPNSIAWVELDRNTRESWRRKALPDLVDAARAKDSK
jgi:hypothetical protein